MAGQERRRGRDGGRTLPSLFAVRHADRSPGCAGRARISPLLGTDGFKTRAARHPRYWVESPPRRRLRVAISDPAPAVRGTAVGGSTGGGGCEPLPPPSILPVSTVEPRRVRLELAAASTLTRAVSVRPQVGRSCRPRSQTRVPRDVGIECVRPIPIDEGNDGKARGGREHDRNRGRMYRRYPPRQLRRS